MNLFFDVEKYFQHIESPRIPKGLSRSEEAGFFFNKYVDGFLYEYLDEVINNARRFLEESLSDSMCQKFIDKGFSMEVLSLKLILEKLEDFCKEGGLSRKPQHTVLISREAF
ncbi:MAG: hypothetical protein K6F69_07410, partial [Treponema sp.]|nr:hypothetical protein [Treponema sp.]